MEDRTDDIARVIEYTLADYEGVLYTTSKHGVVQVQMIEDDVYSIYVERL